MGDELLPRTHLITSDGGKGLRPEEERKREGKVNMGGRSDEWVRFIDLSDFLVLDHGGCVGTPKRVSPSW